MPGWGGWASLDGSLGGGAPAVGRNLDGRLEVFAEAPGAADTELAHIWQDPAAPTLWSDWASLGAPPGQFLGFPAVGRNADGRLEVFVRVGLMSTGDVCRAPHCSQRPALRTASTARSRLKRRFPYASRRRCRATPEPNAAMAGWRDELEAA